MKKQRNVLLSFVLTLALVVGLSVPYADAAGKVKLSSKKVTVKVGQKKTIKVKNTKKKAKWTIKKGKKYISLSKKKKTSVVVKGKKAGKAVVTAKIGKKKLNCAVTVEEKDAEKKDAEKKDNTPTPATSTDSGTKATPTPTNPSTSNSPTPTPTGSSQDKELEPVQNIVIDLTGLTTTFTSSPAKIDFSKQIESRFDLSLFSQMKVGYELVFADDDKSDFNAGKIGIAQTAGTLDGYDDGVAHNLNAMTVGSTTGTISLSGKSGTVVGINIQPMNGKYNWPDKLVSVTITSIEFIAKAGAVYPDPDAPVVPTPTPGPTYAPEKFVYEGLNTSWIDPEKPMVAFTFDDGPVGNTDTDTSMVIQKALKKYNAHATFFYIGSQINSDAKKAEILSAKENGFEVGNHSWGWNSMSSLNEEAIKKSIEDTNAVLKEITGFNNFMFRAPNLSVSAAMRGYIRAPFANCAVDSKDWMDNPKTTTEQIITNVKAAKDGDIVLMHETQANTAAAIETLLQYFTDQGFQVVSVSEMFAAKGKDLMTGTVYSKCQ